jgi:hypothetical protein
MRQATAAGNNRLAEGPVFAPGADFILGVMREKHENEADLLRLK